jgi:hypothetical protein
MGQASLTQKLKVTGILAMSLMLFVACKMDAQKVVPGCSSNGNADEQNPHCGLPELNVQLNYSVMSEQLEKFQSEDGFANHNARGFAFVGDIDHDGSIDFVVGSPWHSQPQLAKLGTVYVYSGKTGSLLFNLFGEELNDKFGYNVAAAGDVNGDGTPDILVSTTRGTVYVFSGLDSSLLFRQTSDGVERTSSYGYSISGAGDFNGDGRADFVIGDPSYNNHQGRVWIISGADFSTLRSIIVPNSNELGFRVAHSSDGVVYLTSRAWGEVYAYSYVQAAPLYVLSGSHYNFGNTIARLATLIPTAMMISSFSIELF